MIYWGIFSPSDTSLHCPWSLLHTRSSSCAPWKWFQEIFHFGQSKPHPAEEEKTHIEEEKRLTSQTDAGRWSQTSLFHYTAPPARITWYTCEDSRDRTKKKNIKSRFKILLPWACRAPCADSGSGFYKHPSPGQESPPEPGWLVGWFDVRMRRSDRATTWVQEPVGFLPADQVALGELFTTSDL